MKKKFMFHYLVQRNEKVTITVEPFKVGPRVTAAQNGKTISNTGGNKPKFSFTVTEPIGNSHFAVVDFGFVEDDDEKAEYRPTVSGSKGGSFPTNPVKKDSKKKKKEFEFEVVAN